MDLGTFSLLGLAGALGTWARYGVGVWAQARFGDLPVGTLVVNVVGSFLMASITASALAGASLSPQLRLVLTTGFLGGFTTYSAFNQETLRALTEQRWLFGVGYLVVTVLGALLASLFGLWLARRIG